MCHLLPSKESYNCRGKDYAGGLSGHFIHVPDPLSYFMPRPFLADLRSAGG